ncbi:unnamed protein product [Caenorhabditis auriculariae]|uniref:Uncharacterized protein n=1 Tax=Caenorhabditis auriculariae TaxID=2777116 RepID=A0A8S1GVZ4_9PELO|nr:unnamed protein product [Caenorhabditis auriculariae]
MTTEKPDVSKAEEREIDKEYLASLEKKLKSLKDPKKITTKTFLSDLANHRDNQLFNLLSASSSQTTSNPDVPLEFEDNFTDTPIAPNYLRRKVAPQTCAINKQELAHLVKHDLTQKVHDIFLQLDQTSEDRLESEKIIKELRDLADELKKEKDEA